MFKNWAKLCTSASVLILSVSAPAADPLGPARTNPLVFNFFRQQLLESNAHEDPYGRRYVEVDVRSVDGLAYALARDFCFQVDKRLDDLEQGFQHVQSARSEALRDSGKARPGVRAEWSESLRRVATTARKLHGMLRLILADFRHEAPPAPGVGAQESDRGFEYETKVLGEQILRVDQRIKGFLSGTAHTVSLEELRSGDILMLLSRVQAEAGEMEERLDPGLQPNRRTSKPTGE